MPECRSRRGPVMTTSMRGEPAQHGGDGRRVLVPLAGIAHQREVGRHLLAVLGSRKPGSDGEPHSSSPSISTLTPRADSSPATRLPGPRGLEEGHELALVVLRAARHDHLAVELVGGDARLERRRFPQLERIGRLHVVVAVEQHMRRCRRRPLPGRGRRPWGDPWSAPRGRRSRCRCSSSRAPVGRRAAAAPCRPGRSRRLGCAAARTGARAPASLRRVEGCQHLVQLVASWTVRLAGYGCGRGECGRIGLASKVHRDGTRARA